MIFLDTNYIIALFIKEHDFHERAVEIFEKIKNRELIISNSIILEVMTVLNIRLKVHKDILEDVFSNLNSDMFEIIEDIGLYYDTMQRMISYYPERLPFFDCLYIELMNQMGIVELVSFDGHFDNKGITRVC